MKIAFKIKPQVDESVELHLLTEVGDEDTSFLIFSKNPFKIQGFYSLHFKKNIEPRNYGDDIKKYIQESAVLQDENLLSATVCYNFSTSTLIPSKYFIEGETQHILNELFVPDKSRIGFNEPCNSEGIKNVYSVPVDVNNFFNEQYPLNKFVHSTSYQLKNIIGSAMQCIIYNASIKLIFFKAGDLQIVQYFDYSTPADVCYRLLNVAERFEVAASDIELSLSGMIDVSSSLYEELYKYFLKINFAETQDITVSESMEELPTHFYQHLTALAYAHN